MKSKHLLLMLLLALLAPWAANGQTLNEGFESSTFPPDDWTAIHVSGNNSWARYTSYHHTGDASAYAHWASAGHENYLITPKLVPAAGEALTFYVSAQSYGGTTLKVELSTTTPTAAAFTTELASYTTGSSGTIGTTSPSTWVEKTIPASDLAAYVGQQIYIAFHVIDDNGGDVLIDDVTGVSLYVPSCTKPNTLTATAPYGYDAAHCILLQWEDGSGSYNVQLKKASESEEQWQTKAGGVSLVSMLFNDLDPATTYNARVQSVCGGDVSDWKTVTFTTGCGAITTFPWSETFESYASGNFSDPCWVNEHISGDGTQVFKISTSSMDGNSTHQLQLPDMTGGTLTKLVLPEMTLNGNYQFVLDVYRSTSTYNSNYPYEGVRVYASTDGQIEGATEITFIPRHHNVSSSLIPVETAAGWYTYELLIPITSGTCYIILQGESQYCTSTYMDNFIVRLAPTCLKPIELSADNITTSSADLSWTAQSGETTWNIYYKKTSEELWEEVQNVTANPYTLQGLDPASNYQFKVVAKCSATDLSEETQPVAFLTECEAISALGFTENFDSYTAGDKVLPICWSYINTTTTSYYQAYPKIYNYSANSPSNCLYFSSYYSSSYDPQPQYAILPEMNNLTGKRITLQARGSNTASSFRVGTMSDPTDASSFTEVTNTDNPAAMTTSYQEYFFDIPSTTDRYVAIMIEAANTTRTSNGVYIDDIVFSVSPTCFKPTEAHAEVQDANNATISWTPDSRNTAGGSYSILDEELNVVEGAESLTGTSFTLSGLTESHDYTYYVRTNCFNSEENVDLVEVAFSTPADCGAPILEADAFTNISAHKATVTWTGYTSNTAYEVSYRNPAYIDGLSEEFSGSSLPTGWTRYSGLVDDVIAGTATLTTSTSGWGMVTAASNVFSSNHVKINIYGASVKNWLVTPEINLPANSAMSFDLAQTSYSSSGNSTSAASGTREDDRLVVLITTDDGATWEILREWNNSGSSDVFNDISETPQTVNIPLASYTGNVKVAFYGESTVNNNGDNDMHIDNVTIGTAVPASAWQMVSPNPTAASTTLTGLTAETPYEVKVKGICNGGVESEESDIQSFTTTIACPKPNTLTVAANAVDPTTKEDLTWVMTGAETDWQISRLNGAVENIIDINESEVSINPTTHEVSYTLSGLTPGQDYTVKVRANCEASVPGDQTSDWSNTQIFQTEATCVEPTAFANSNVDATSAALSWTEAGSAEQWQLCVNDDMDNLITLSSTDDDVTVSGHNVSYTLTGLTAATAYTVKLRAYCADGDGNQSSWVTTSFTTLCGTYTLPYSYGFEDASDLECWNVIKTNSSTGISNADDAPEGTHVFRFYYNENPDAYLVSPVFSGTEQGLDVSFQYMNSSSSSSYTEQFQVGYTTDANAAVADFIFGDVIEGENSWQTYENTFPANTKRIAIKYIYTDGMYLRLDDFNFEAAASCPKPTALTVDDIYGHGATVSWNGAADGYNVRYREAEHADYYFFDDFESGLDQWTIIRNGDGTENTDWRQFNGNFGSDQIDAHSGTYMAMSRSWNSGAYNVDNWLITPQVTLNGTLKFWVRDDGSYHEHYDVYVSTTGNSVDDFTLLHAPGDASGTWTEITVDLSSYAGALGYIALRNTDEDQDYLMIDDFGIYSSTIIPAGSWVETTTTDNSIEISGLDPQTSYDFEVQANCGSEGVSVMVATTFRTNNVTCSVPTSLMAITTTNSADIAWEGIATNYNVRYRTAEVTNEYYFTNFNTSADRDGWTWEGNAIYGIDDPIYNYAGDDNYFLPMGWATTDETYIYSPELPEYESGAVMEFYYFAYNSTNTFQVGLSTTTNDATAFTWSEPITSGTNYYTDLYSEVLPAGVKYIAFKATAEDQYHCIFIDNFHVYKLVSATGDWVNATANANSMEITGLTPATNYEWQVQADCGSTDGESEWSAIAQFTTANPSFTKSINANSWYAISSPVNTPNVTDVTNLTVDDYDFYRYDEATATWENYKAHTSTFSTFENGRGYIYRNSTGNDLTFTGVPNTAANYPYILTTSGSGDLKGFNLLGNPFANPYIYSGNCYALTEKGTWMAKTNYTIPVCEAVLVKVSSEVNYPYLSTKSAPKAVEALAFTVSGNGYEDVTYAMLEEGEGLNKVAHLATEAPALSIPVDGSNYAIAYLGYEVESFPLTLNAQAGEYTIALNNQISGLSYCHLLDKVTGKETDLLKGAYTFKANGNSDRFTVLLNASLENGEIAIWNGNSWIVNGEGTLQVFDVMGRRVYNQEVAGQSSLNTDELATGVYVIRLGEKSQKIVVK